MKRPDSSVEQIRMVEFIRHMRGHTQSKLMRGENGKFYVVKFRNNPLGCCALVNDWVGSHIAREIGLPVPQPVIVYVDPWLARKSTVSQIAIRGASRKCAPGSNFGSTYVDRPMETHVLDYFPEALLTPARVKNIEVLFGALAFDMWTLNSDHRQFVFWKPVDEKRYTIALIDQSSCFCDGALISPHRKAVSSLYRAVYENAAACQFEPWLTRIEELHATTVEQNIHAMPRTWRKGQTAWLRRAVSGLMVRRARLRRALSEYQKLVACSTTPSKQSPAASTSAYYRKGQL